MPLVALRLKELQAQKTLVSLPQQKLVNVETAQLPLGHQILRLSRQFATRRNPASKVGALNILEPSRPDCLKMATQPETRTQEKEKRRVLNVLLLEQLASLCRLAYLENPVDMRAGLELQVLAL